MTVTMSLYINLLQDEQLQDNHVSDDSLLLHLSISLLISGGDTRPK
jgi:hypothetical protein